MHAVMYNYDIETTSGHTALRKEETKMKKVTSLILVLALLVCGAFTLSSCNSSGADEKIYVQTNAFFAPFEYYDGTEIVGVDVEIMELVGEKLGKEIVWTHGEFGIIIDLVSQGVSADCGAAGITVTDERAAKVDFSNTYFTSIQYVVLDKNTAIETKTDANGNEYVVWESLAGMSIATQTDTTGWIYADCEIDCEGGVLYGTEGTEHTAMDSANVAADALGTTIDALIVDELPAQYLTNNNDSFKCYPLYYSGAEGEEDSAVIEEYAIAVTKGNTELLNAINEVLATLLVKDENGETAIDKMVMAHMGMAD